MAPSIEPTDFAYCLKVGFALLIAFLKLSQIKRQTLTFYELAENAVNNSEQHVTPGGLLGLIFVWHVPLASQSCYTFCGQL